ncbi:MAG: head GIN domain-containing protein [Maribacter sp.]|uniref:head GIN domain-containing protein n=1 Tax=Maribacter sp. 2307UL18-2 TaxID=3386274 RepID=UPI0039BD6FF9
MKIYFSLFALILMNYVGHAQREIVVELKSFTEIKAFDRIRTVLIKSNENKVVITGDDQDDVNVSVKSGLLKIKMDFENQMDGGDVTATVYHTEPFTLIDANENAEITSDDTILGTEVKLAAQEGGKITLKVDIEDLYVKSTSGAAITLTGKVRKQEVVANAGGKVWNEDLSTTETKVTVNAGGTARVHATDKMEAKVRAGGSIYVYGNPKDLKRDKIFGGKIKVMD